MGSIRLKKWGECYKRVIAVDSEENTGLTATPVQLADGDGVKSAMMLGTNSAGMYLSSPFFYGGADLYIKKLRSGVMTIVAPRVVFSGTLSLLQLYTPLVSTQEIRGVNKIVAPVLSCEEINASNLNVLHHTFEDIDATNINACTGTFTGIVNANKFEGNALDDFLVWDEV